MSLWNRSRDFWRTCGPKIVPLREMSFEKNTTKKKSFIHTSFCPNDLFLWGGSNFTSRIISLHTRKAKESSFVLAPIKSKGPGGFEMVQLEMIDPHVMISYIWNVVGLQLDPQDVKSYWDHHRQVRSPWTTACLDASSDMIPLGIYGDSAKARQLPFTAPEKVVGIFLNCPIFRPKSVRQSRWLLFSIQEDLLFGRKTLNAIYRRVTWSINSMWFGYLPTQGPFGEPLLQQPGVPITTNFNKFCVTEIRGDWSWHKTIFGLVSSWKGGANCAVCWKCPSYAYGDSRHHYYHIDDQSMDRTPEHTLVEFMLKEIPEEDICSFT